MKLIIEGTDNVGKDFFIKHLNFTGKQFHCISPGKFLPNIDPIEAQRIQFVDIFDSTMDEESFLLNRSHIGECVYGPIYRNTDGDWVFDIEKYYPHILDATLVYLYAPAEFSIKNDDGLSHSTEISKRENELKLFEDAIKKSNIKRKIFIQVADTEFRNINDILNEFYEKYRQLNK